MMINAHGVITLAYDHSHKLVGFLWIISIIKTCVEIKLRAKSQDEKRYGNKIIIFDRKMNKKTLILIWLVWLHDANSRNVNCFRYEILNERIWFDYKLFSTRTRSVISVVCCVCSNALLSYLVSGRKFDLENYR